MKDLIRPGIIILFAFLLGLLGLSALMLLPQNTDGKIIRVENGDTAKSIASKLHSQKIIRSPLLFVEMVRLSRSDRYLKSGTYVFEGRISMLQTINILKKGKSHSINITIPEGFSLYRALKRIDASGLASFDELMSAATDTAVVRRLTGFNAKSLEGFLYPDTYRFDIGSSAEQILDLQSKRFFEKLKESEIAIEDSSAFYREMILASIVEKEAIFTDEKPKIAAVFLNRMKLAMKLESCPTVDYILERQGIRRSVLTYADTNIRSDYNTYLVLGLPPTPICTPTPSSIMAVRNPERHRYLYFFADNKGRNIFSSTYEEHLQKQRAHRNARAKKLS